jgi:hypothetical protein
MFMLSSASRTFGHFRVARMVLRTSLMVALTTAASLQTVSAQEDQGNAPLQILSRVALDPTTYAATVLAYQTTMRDWETSQVFFEHGFHERNPRFTISGLPEDVPVGYEEGRRRIFKDAMLTLGATAAQNAVGRTVERYLVSRFPRRTRLIKTMGWIQRASLASYWSYRLSVQHYRQTQYNLDLAQSLGYR